MTESSPRESQTRHGSKIGRFVVVGELGKGGMGIVYAAHDRELDRQVALKVMRLASVEEVDRVRMLREGQAMARITHPNVITVFEVGSEDGVVFLAQELLDGGTLGEWLETARSLEAILDKFIAAGRGLAAAHAVALVHRDFKPENVLLGRDGRVRVADFGLAREVGGAEAALMATAPGGGPPPSLDGPPETDSCALARNLTRTGVVMGTPMFMAPEQHEGKTADARSDQFAFCVALYHALHNDWPFDGKTAVALADNVIHGRRKAPPASVKLPVHLRSALSRGLSTNAADRFPTMEALLAELGKRPASAKKPLMVIAGIVVAGAGAAASIAVLGDRGSATASQQPVVQPSPIPVSTERRELDPSALAQALDLGQLDSARRKFDDDAVFLQQDPAKAASAKAASALMLVLRGEIAEADTKLKDAESATGNDPVAVGYAHMAAAAIAWAKGDLTIAIERGKQCVASLATVPVAASICHQIHGDAEADRGNDGAARAAYAAGMTLAERAREAQRIAELQLSIAQLDFDAKQEDVSLDTIVKLQKDARRRGAVSCEATAAVLASRIKLAKADPQGALDVFDDVNPDVLQAYRTKMIAKLTLGQLHGYRHEADEEGVVGLDRIDAVIADAKQKGFAGVELEARLGRVLVKVITGADDAEAERAKLVADAKARSYGRIAKLAASFNREPPPAESLGPE